MSGYEFMFILDPTLDDAASLAVVDRVETIVKGQGGEIVSLKPWERRRLAYPIGGHNEGLYMLCYFDAPPTAITGIQSRVRLTEGVLRFLVLRTDQETRERDQAADDRRRQERAARAAAEAAAAAEAGDAPAPAGDAAAPAAATKEAAAPAPATEDAAAPAAATEEPKAGDAASGAAEESP